MEQSLYIKWHESCIFQCYYCTFHGFWFLCSCHTQQSCVDPLLASLFAVLNGNITCCCKLAQRFIWFEHYDLVWKPYHHHWITIFAPAVNASLTSWESKLFLPCEPWRWQVTMNSLRRLFYCVQIVMSTLHSFEECLLLTEHTATESVHFTVHREDLRTTNNWALSFHATTCRKTHQTEPLLWCVCRMLFITQW